MVGREIKVGWLERGHAFPMAEVPAGFVARLQLLHAHSLTQLTEGRHYCDLCPPHGPWGNAQLRAIGADGTRYIAPSLIVHYVTDHRYAPPQAFIDAVLRVSIDLQEAMAKDLCLSCGNAMTRTSATSGYRGWPWCDPALIVELACATCGADYSRDLPE